MCEIRVFGITGNVPQVFCEVRSKAVKKRLPGAIALQCLLTSVVGNECS